MMDFEDLLVLTYQLFKENPNILEYYQDEFKYILVDELQDTNVVQYDIINLLCQKYENIFAVGVMIRASILLEVLKLKI